MSEMPTVIGADAVPEAVEVHSTIDPRDVVAVSLIVGGLACVCVCVGLLSGVRGGAIAGLSVSAIYIVLGVFLGVRETGTPPRSESGEGE